MSNEAPSVILTIFTAHLLPGIRDAELERQHSHAAVPGRQSHLGGGERFDLIINATAAGLSGAVPAIPDGCLTEAGWTYDMLYGTTPTDFCRWGERQGAARVLDGLGMLVEQAAESFWLWRGVRPETVPVIAMLR